MSRPAAEHIDAQEAAKREEAITYIRGFIWRGAKEHSLNFPLLAAAVEVLRFLEADCKNGVGPRG